MDKLIKRIHSITWGFPSDITTSDASEAAAITKPPKPYPAPSSIIDLDLFEQKKTNYLVSIFHTQGHRVRRASLAAIKKKYYLKNSI